MVNVQGDGPAAVVQEVADQIAIREIIDFLVDWEPCLSLRNGGQPAILIG